MITNDIQQLLDGSLDDEQAAELLHTLSVSPEKRVAFQQHLALGALMSQDRAAIALSPEEQAAIWGNIKGGVGASVSAASATPARWLGRGAALLTAGVIGYLLGTVTLFSPSTTEMAGSSASPRVAPTAAAPRIAVESAPAVRDSIIYRDRVVYRDRIVYRDRASNTNAVTAATKATPDRGSSTASTPRSSTSQPNQNIPTPANVGSSISSPATPRLTDSLPQNGSTLRTPASTPVPSPVDTIGAVKPPRSIATAPEVSPRSIDPEMVIASAFDRNGWEVSLSERVGMLLPAPEGIDDADGKFNYRNADVAYRFGNGRYSVGGRLVYGTFSAFSLEPDASSSLTFVDAVPSLQAEEKFWGEVFAGYRLPITSGIALAGELSFGRSADHVKVGGDLLVVAMLTDRIGMQAGGGFGRYWYDLASEREKLFNDHENENVGIRDVARASYNGPIIEGRYGLFFNF